MLLILRLSFLVRHIHVRGDIPVIAFGVKVPKPEFG